MDSNPSTSALEDTVPSISPSALHCSLWKWRRAVFNDDWWIQNRCSRTANYSLLSRCLRNPTLKIPRHHCSKCYRNCAHPCHLPRSHHCYCCFYHDCRSNNQPRHQLHHSEHCFAIHWLPACYYCSFGERWTVCCCVEGHCLFRDKAVEDHPSHHLRHHRRLRPRNCCCCHDGLLVDRGCWRFYSGMQNG